MKIRLWIYGTVLMAVFSLFLLQPITAQSDPCSLSAVLSSFQAAALSDSIETWAQRYADSECMSNIKRGVQQLVGSYSTLSDSPTVSIPFAAGPSLIPNPENPLELNPALRWRQGYSTDNSYLYDPLSSTITIMALRGSQLWQRTNNTPMFRYAIEGDFEASVRLQFAPNNDYYKTAGMVILSGTDEFTWYRLFRLNVTNGGQIINSGFTRDGIYQDNLNRDTNYRHSVTYMRIARSGNMISSSFSPDGIDWTIGANQVPFSLPDRVFIVLTVESVTNSQAAVAQFSEFVVNPIE